MHVRMVRLVPFGSSTIIPFDVRPGGATVRIEIFDAGGRRVRTLTDRFHAAGRHSLSWDGTDARGRAMPSGAYFLRLVTDDREFVKRLTLAR